ncbi:MAG: F0F1 ATP synthase subunit A [Solobacterium sp.]|nr:F0F1 ATP synthase subunit A [Solobacterium sp.]
MNVELQADVFRIIFVTILIALAMIIISKKIDRTDPLAQPKGIIVPAILGVQKVYEDVKESVGPKHAELFTPYILAISIYIFLSNVISLFGISSPTANLSVTLTLAIITWVITQVASFRYSGVKAWFHSFLEPIPVLLPINILSKFSSIISMSLRLFGNILCGGIMMSLVYAGAQALSNLIGHLFVEGSVFNFMGPVIAPVLHAYFDIFAGFIQTLVFVTLTMVFVGVEIPDELKRAK